MFSQGRNIICMEVWSVSGSLKHTRFRMNVCGSHVVSCSDLFFGRRDECDSKDERSDCQVRVAFTWSWKVRGDGVGAAVWVRDARVFPQTSLWRRGISSHIPCVVCVSSCGTSGSVLLVVMSCEFADWKGALKICMRGILKRCRRRLLPSFVTGVISPTFSFPLGEAHFVRVCDLLCVPSYLKFWCGGDRLRLGTRDTCKSFAVSVSFCSICVAPILRN